MDTKLMDWEVYDDQDGSDFKLVGYTDLSGTDVLVPIESNLTSQVAEIRRKNGSSLTIKLYRDRVPSGMFV